MCHSCHMWAKTTIIFKVVLFYRYKIFSMILTPNTIIKCLGKNTILCYYRYTNYLFFSQILVELELHYFYYINLATFHSFEKIWCVYMVRIICCVARRRAKLALVLSLRRAVCSEVQRWLSITTWLVLHLIPQLNIFFRKLVWPSMCYATLGLACARIS